MPDRQYNTTDDKICLGCPKRQWMAVGDVCSVYEHPEKTYGYRAGECALNPQLKKSNGPRVRVGQKKTKRVSE